MTTVHEAIALLSKESALRREQLEDRKAALARLLGRVAPGLRFNEHLVEEDGPLVFHHADAEIVCWPHLVVILTSGNAGENLKQHRNGLRVSS
jgi:hypothetical protein